MNAVLAVSDLTVRFRSETGPVVAVENLSFEVHSGEVLTLVGESGCGKSVTAMSILGLLPPSADIVSGTILFEGQDLFALSARQMRAVRGRSIAMVFQEPMTSLNPSFTVGRQISEVLRRHEGLSSRRARERVVELLGLVGIPVPERRVGEYPHQLSGGMRQRVMIAMAVACGPKVLIADEPTTALDVTIQAGILDVIRGFRRRLDTATILITHDLGVVADMADRVAVLYAGRKVEEAPVDDLFDAPQHPYTQGLLAAVPGPFTAGDGAAGPHLQEIPGIVPTRASAADHCVFAPRCPRASSVCRTQLPLLEHRGRGHTAACFHPGLEPQAARP